MPCFTDPASRRLLILYSFFKILLVIFHRHYDLHGNIFQIFFITEGFKMEFSINWLTQYLVFIKMTLNVFVESFKIFPTGLLTVNLFSFIQRNNCYLKSRNSFACTLINSKVSNFIFSPENIAKVSALNLILIFASNWHIWLLTDILYMEII